MSELLRARLAQSTRRCGLNARDLSLLTAALILTKAMKIKVGPSESMRNVLARVADRLEARAAWDGLTGAQDWLRNPSLPDKLFDQMDMSVASFLSVSANPIDWDAELAAILEDDLSRDGVVSMGLAIAQALIKVLDIPSSGECACAFAASASIAWCLAKTRPVHLYVGDPDVACLFAMFAAGSGRRLSVDRRNPLDGSFMAVNSDNEGRGHAPLQATDHLISIPPFGIKIRDSGGAMVPLEGVQIERLRRFARHHFWTVIPDNFLFRDGRSNVKTRRQIVEEGGVQVDSLPAGLFGRQIGLSTSLARLTPHPTQEIKFVDGRSMTSNNSGKVQERLLVQHLGAWGDIVQDKERSTVVPVAMVAENGYALVPDRYLRPRSLQAIQEAAAKLPQVSILDVATIERGKAPRPMHELDGEPALICRELAPGDLQGGVARQPQRQLAFSLEEVERARNVAVKAGDILVSIKGNVGRCGIVPAAAPAPDSEEPWIISQSLAIIRYRPNPHVPSPEVLNAILTAPWVRENLERLAAGSTVRSLSMGDLRQVKIPLLSAEEFGRAQEAIEWLAHQLALIERSQHDMWKKLWGLSPIIPAE